MTPEEPSGPRPMGRRQRRALVDEIAGRLRGRFGDEIVAVGVYGSVARDADAAYSDVEMHCLLDGAGIDERLEWTPAAARRWRCSPSTWRGALPAWWA